MHGSYSELSFERNSEIVNHKKKWNIYFSPLPLVLDAYIMSNTNRKMGLSCHFERWANLIWYIILVIWKLLKFHHIKSPPIPQEKRNFLLFEEYRYLTTSAVNAFFWSFWAVNQLILVNHALWPVLSLNHFSGTIGSGDMNSGQF